MKTHVTLTLDPEIVKKNKRIAGLVPFSRYVEQLLRKEVEIRTKQQEQENG